MSEPVHRLVLRIAPEHPSLPGHFPGAPVVPGVVLLDEVLSAAERHLGRPFRARALKQAKFPASLLPAQQAQLELTFVGSEVRFTITHDMRTIAQGSFAAFPPGLPPATEGGTGGETVG